MLITEGELSPDSDRETRRFPGIASSFSVDVNAATITVLMSLSLYALLEITTTGRRYPGSEPNGGAASSAHQISPRLTQHLELCALCL